MAQATSKTRVRSGEAVYDTLREMALEYRFRPGEKINEGEVASLLGVSRTPVREALNRLVAEGLIGFRRNHGFYCRSLDMAEVMNLAEAVRDLELALLDHVAMRATHDALKDLAGYSKGVAESVESLPACELARADEAFHARFAALAANPVLTGISRNLNARIRFLRKIMIEEAPDKAAHFRAQHELIALLSEGKQEAARTALAKTLTLDPDRVRDALARGLGRIYLDRINMDASLSP